MRYVRIGMNDLQIGMKHGQSNEGLQVRVGHDQLVGEVIRIEADRATVQVYEETGMNEHVDWDSEQPLTDAPRSWRDCGRSCYANREASIGRIGSWTDGNHLRRHSAAFEVHRHRQ